MEIYSVNSSKKRTIALSGFVALSLLAAACGSSSSTKTTSAPTTAAGVTTTAVSSSTAGSATTVVGSSTPTTSATSGAPTTSTATSPSTGGSTTPIDYASLKGSLTGSGSTFQKAFLDEAIANLAKTASGLSIQYGGGGSGKGRTDLQTKLVDYAGTDGTVKAADVAKYTGGAFVYIPTVIAPITMSFNVSGVDP